MVTDDDVQRIALALPDVIQSGSGFGVRNKGFAWFYQEKIEGQRGRTERRDVIAIWVGLDEKAILLASDAEKYFTTDHYRNYPAILVRLPEMEEVELTELLTAGWLSRAPRKLIKAFEASAMANRFAMEERPEENEAATRSD